MAALHTLWMGLVLLGVLGVLQTQAQVQVSLQPNFQQDKVRGSPAQSPRQHRALSREGGTLWGRVVFLGRGEQSGRRRLTTITPVPGPAVIR